MHNPSLYLLQPRVRAGIVRQHRDWVTPVTIRPVWNGRDALFGVGWFRWRADRRGVVRAVFAAVGKDAAVFAPAGATPVAVVGGAVANGHSINMYGMVVLIWVVLLRVWEQIGAGTAQQVGHCLGVKLVAAGQHVAVRSVEAPDLTPKHPSPFSFLLPFVQQLVVLLFQDHRMDHGATPVRQASAHLRVGVDRPDAVLRDVFFFLEHGFRENVRLLGGGQRAAHAGRRGGWPQVWFDLQFAPFATVVGTAAGTTAGAPFGTVGRGGPRHGNGVVWGGGDRWMSPMTGKPKE